MLARVVCGEVPSKHHIAFRNAEGRLRHEECFTRAGFDGPYTIAYHVNRPHAQHVAETRHGWKVPAATAPRSIAKRHYRTQDLESAGGAPVDARVPLLFNQDVAIAMVTPGRADPVYVANGDADDLFYVFEGGGLLRTPLGDLRFEKDDYLHVPRGMLHRFLPDPRPQRWLALECLGGVGIPKQWRNEAGQLRMDAPYSHRDFRLPEFRGPLDEGIREQVVKRNGAFHGFRLESSPLDVVGWDGAVYPVAFPILNFQPRAGLVHLPPTWHGTFAARGALVCSFVPRVVDLPQGDPLPLPARQRRRGRDPLLRSRRVHEPPWGRAGIHLAPPGRRDARAAPRRLRGLHRGEDDERARGDARLLPAAHGDAGGARGRGPGVPGELRRVRRASQPRSRRRR
jgi:homogentisate 1,2-dioxygenase